MAVYEVGVGKPYSTIQGAIDQLRVDNAWTTFTEEQEVRVYNGTYDAVSIDNQNTNVIYPTPQYQFLIKSAEGEHPVIDGQNLYDSGVYLSHLNYTKISGFEIKNFNSVGIEGFNSKFITSYDNSIHNIAGSGIKMVQLTGHFTSSQSFYFYNNIIHDVTDYGIYILTTPIGAEYTDVHNNLIYNFVTAGIYLHMSGNNGIVGNNTIYSSVGYGIQQDWYCCYFENNLIYMSGGYCLAGNFDGYVWGSNYNNLFYTGTAQCHPSYATLADWQTTGDDVNSISSDPLFLSLGSNFHLSNSSPCGSVGADLSAYFTDDLDKNTRIIPWDIGAYKSSSYISRQSGSLGNPLII